MTSQYLARRLSANVLWWYNCWHFHGMVQHGYGTTNFQIPNRTFRTIILGWWCCQEWKDEETDTPVVLEGVVVGCRNVVSGVSRDVSGVVTIHFSTCELCMTSNRKESKLHAAFSVFCSQKTTPRLTKYTMDQSAGEWSGCEGFFSSIFCGRGCKGPGHQCVATRGLRGTARRRGRTINVPSISLDRPSLRNTSHYCKPLFKHGQRDAMMKNWSLRLGWWHQQRIDDGCSAKCMIFFNAWCVKDARMVDN